MSDHANLTKLTLDELAELLDRSSILGGADAESFAKALHEVPLYANQPRLQLIHSKALLSRMQTTGDFQEALLLSHIQENVPSLYLSLTLRQVFARGLVITAYKNPIPTVLKRAVARIFELPSFGNCPVLQRCAAELLLEGIAAAEDQESAKLLLQQLESLPGLQYNSELQDLVVAGRRQVKRAGRDPIVKIDLNQKTAGPVKAVRKLFGMGDFRLKVELRGLEYYDQAVVRVPALTEKAATKTAQKFIKDFLKEQSGDENKSAKIINVYPPGSTWESGRHPVLKLK